MPSLLNTELAQNYRRTHVGTSRFGTRQIQIYEIYIYMLSDALVDGIYDDSRDIVLDDTDGCDQPAISELRANHIIEAIVRGAQQVAEIAIVGRPDFWSYDPDDNTMAIDIAVYADTVDSGQEQFVHTNYQNFQANNNATDLQNSIGASVEQWIIANEEQWDGLDVYAGYLHGDGTDSYGPYNALSRDDPAVQAYRSAKTALHQAARAARVSAGRVGYAPKR